MKNYKYKILVSIIGSIFSLNVKAQTPSENAGHFTSLYTGLCMQHLTDLEAFRKQLSDPKLPKLPADKAAFFLDNKEGDAWPIPFQGQLGNFVLALPAGGNICLLYARRASQNDVERQFSDLVKDAPSPLVSEHRTDEKRSMGTNDMAHTTGYIWSIPGATKKMMFALTTRASDDASIQAMASAAMIKD